MAVVEAALALALALAVLAPAAALATAALAGTSVLCVAPCLSHLVGRSEHASPRRAGFGLPRLLPFGLITNQHKEERVLLV